jgi:hypothetical protein
MLDLGQFLDGEFAPGQQIEQSEAGLVGQGFKQGQQHESRTFIVIDQVFLI